ncbi:hypothetical protein D1872_291370 [compost metagenome]
MTYEEQTLNSPVCSFLNEFKYNGLPKHMLQQLIHPIAVQVIPVRSFQRTQGDFLSFLFMSQIEINLIYKFLLVRICLNFHTWCVKTGDIIPYINNLQSGAR